MENNSLKIRMLVISELSGTITQEEKALLDQLRNEYPEIKLFSDDIYRTLEPVRDNALMMEIPSVEEIFELADGKPPKVLSLGKILKVACILSISLTGSAIFYYYHNKNKQDFLLAQKTNVTFSIGNQQIVINDTSGFMESNRYLVVNNERKQLKPGIIWKDSTCKISVPAGKVFKITLSDNTAILMEPQSYAEFPLKFSNQERKIKLQGEAYLIVAKDVRKPFIVSLPNNTVKVIGTEFNVNTYKNGEENIALVEGSVNIKNSKYAVTLKAGQQVFLNKENSTIKSFDKDSLLSCRQGIFNIANVPIDTVPVLVEKYFATKLVIDKSAKGKVSFIVLDRHKTVEYFLNVYKETTSLALDKKDNVYHLY